MDSHSIEGHSKNNKGLTKATLLLILCWVVYTCSYIGKLSYGANIGEIREAFGGNAETEAGLVSTFFFFSYAIGQIINGLLCKRYNIKYVVCTCLMVGGAMNVLIALSPDIRYLKFIWLVNGIAMSFLWPTLIRLLSETLKKENVDKAIVVMGTTVATGTFLVYGMSALFVGIANFKWTFFLAAALLITVAIIWFFSFDGLVKPLKKEADEEHEAERNSVEAESLDGRASSVKITKNFLIVLVCVLAFFAAANNYVKDGLTTWTPAILKDVFNTQGWMSILLTLLLPLLAIPGTVLAVKLYNIVKNFIGTCTLMFVMSAVLMGVVIWTIPTSGTGGTTGLIVTVGAFSLISALMNGIDNIIVSMVPLQLKGKVNSGRLAGVLNGFCYVGSAIATYSLAAIKTALGSWRAMFFVLLAIAGVVILVGIIYHFISRKQSIR